MTDAELVVKRCGGARLLPVAVFVARFLVATRSLVVYPCVPAHVTEHTEAAATAFESADKSYTDRGSNVDASLGGCITHASLPYGYSSGSGRHIWVKKRLEDAVVYAP